MTNARIKIEQAVSATNAVQEYAGKAISCLHHFDGRTVNAFGVYADPDDRRSDLLAARDAISAALALIEATDWPTDQDYETA